MWCDAGDAQRITHTPCGCCRWHVVGWGSGGHYCPSDSCDDPWTLDLWNPPPPGSSAGSSFPFHRPEPESSAAGDLRARPGETPLFLLNTHTHRHRDTDTQTDRHTRLFLWIVVTFHRLLLHLFWPNDIFYPLTLNLPLTENLFAFLHFQINIIYCF